MYLLFLRLYYMFNPLLGQDKKMCDVKTSSVLCCQLIMAQTKWY